MNESQTVQSVIMPEQPLPSLHPALRGVRAVLFDVGGTLLHPDWEYILFTEDGMNRFVQEEFPEYVAIFGAFSKVIQRIDFFVHSMLKIPKLLQSTLIKRPQ